MVAERALDRDQAIQLKYELVYTKQPESDLSIKFEVSTHLINQIAQNVTYTDIPWPEGAMFFQRNGRFILFRPFRMYRSSYTLLQDLHDALRKHAPDHHALRMADVLLKNRRGHPAYKKAMLNK